MSCSVAVFGLDALSIRSRQANDGLVADEPMIYES